MKKKRLEYNASYALYQFEDGSLELIVPAITPAPGYDVCYKLNNSEIKAYNQQGVQSLMEKIREMKKNPRKYVMKPWR